MPVLQPIDTQENCRPAYQLHWNVTIFWNQPMSSADWLDALRQATKPGGGGKRMEWTR